MVKLTRGSDNYSAPCSKSMLQASAGERPLRSLRCTAAGHALASSLPHLVFSCKAAAYQPKRSRKVQPGVQSRFTQNNQR